MKLHLNSIFQTVGYENEVRLLHWGSDAVLWGTAESIMQAEVNQFSAYIFEVNIKYIVVFVTVLSWFAKHYSEIYIYIKLYKIKIVQFYTESS